MKTNFDELFSRFKTIKAGVVGDVMLDTYWWGHVDRISPEAPVPVVALDRKEYRIGGAGNVALNLSCLDASVSMLSIIGNDDDGTSLTDLLQTNRINTEYIIRSQGRITTSKTRVISRNQQMMRLDSEITKDISAEEELLFIDRVKEFIVRERPQVIILEDYNKGVLTQFVIENIIRLCQDHGVLTTVDPKRKNFFAYQGVDIFKPNLKEVKDGLNILAEDISVKGLEEIHQALKEKLHHNISFITLSERGVFYNGAGKSNIIPSHMRSIADVSGAGDTVIAVASLIYATTHNIDLMAQVANIAGGLVCEEVGTVAIRKDKLLHECKLLLNSDSM
jgi:D-glycero-beta-D-manno-heptose-7-phosphate kinase